ncbi:N-acetylneuraminate epimerase [compost metagenome]
MGAAACLNGFIYMATGTWSNSAGTYLDRSIYRLSLGAPGAAWVEYGDQPGEPRLDTARYGAALAGVGGKLYVFGGALLNDTLTHRVESIDAGSLWVQECQVMETGRHGASALVRNGKVYVVGGIDARGKAVANVEVYDVATDTWEVRPRMRVARGHAAAAAIGGKAFVVGGSDGHFVTKSVSPLRAAESMVLE